MKIVYNYLLALIYDNIRGSYDVSGTNSSDINWLVMKSIWLKFGSATELERKIIQIFNFEELDKKPTKFRSWS